MDDSKLIELMRVHPSVYKVKHHQHKDINVRDNVWKEMSTTLKQPMEECRNHWKNIRDTYMRRKRTKKLPTGSARSKKLRKLHLEENLEFLNLVEWERETLTNTTTLEIEDDNTDYKSQKMQMENVEMEGDLDGPENETKETFPETKITQSDITDASNTESICETTEGNEIKLQPSYKRKNSNKKFTDSIVELFKKNSDERAKFLSTILPKQPEEHPIDTFFKSMVTSVKKMSSENQLRAKMHICQIVGQLELNEICSRPLSASASISSVPYDLHANKPNSYTSVMSPTSPASMPDNEMQFMTNISGHHFS